MDHTALCDLKDYVRKYYKLILLSIAAAILCFGFQALNSNIRIDTEELINEPGTTLGWLTIGRYGLVFLKRLLGLSVHSALKSGLFFLLFFTLGANLLTFGFYHLSQKNEKYPYWVFLLLYSTSCIWSFQVYFSMQQAEIALAMLFVIAAALLTVKACFIAGTRMNIIRIAAAAVLLLVGLGTYQALAAYYAAICIAFFLVCFDRLDNKRLLCGISGILLLFAAVYICYSLIAETWFMAAGDYMEGQAAWGRLSFLECVKNILRTMKNVLLSHGPRNFSFYTAGAVLSILVILIIWKDKILKRKEQMLVFLLAVAGILLAPFFMTIYMGEMLVSRSQFALPVTAAFLGMYGISVLKEYRPGFKKITGICSFFVVITVLGQTGYNLRLAYADHVRYAFDTEVTGQVVEVLKETGHGRVPGQPVFFVGYRKPELDIFSRRSEMYGWSFYEWDYSADNPTGATHRIAGFIRANTGIVLQEGTIAEQREAAVKLSHTMPVFPEEGSVFAAEDFVVVKLSEIEDRNDIDWW